MGSLAGAKVGHRMPKLLCPEGTADWAVRHAERTTRFWASRSSRSNLTAHYHMMMRAPAYRDHRQKAAFVQVIGGSVYVHVVHADDFTRNVVRFILIMFEKLWRVRAPRTRAPARERDREPHARAPCARAQSGGPLADTAFILSSHASFGQYPISVHDAPLYAAPVCVPASLPGGSHTRPRPRRALAGSPRASSRTTTGGSTSRGRTRSSSTASSRAMATARTCRGRARSPSRSSVALSRRTAGSRSSATQTVRAAPSRDPLRTCVTRHTSC